MSRTFYWFRSRKLFPFRVLTTCCTRWHSDGGSELQSGISTYRSRDHANAEYSGADQSEVQRRAHLDERGNHGRDASVLRGDDQDGKFELTDVPAGRLRGCGVA